MKTLMTILCGLLFINLSYGFDDFNTCEPGTYTVTTTPNGTGNPITNCIPCQVGSYQPDRGQSSCLLCEEGRFQNQEGQTECKVCEPGFTTTTIGATACVPIGGTLPAMNKWGLLLLVGLVLASATYLLNRRGLFGK